MTQAFTLACASFCCFSHCDLLRGCVSFSVRKESMTRSLALATARPSRGCRTDQPRYLTRWFQYAAQQETCLYDTSDTLFCPVKYTRCRPARHQKFSKSHIHQEFAWNFGNLKMWGLLSMACSSRTGEVGVIFYG